MSNTIYLDVNANNSTILNDTNNRFRYPLPQTLPLPTGTTITCMQSIINQQGITSGSITLNEDVEETIIAQYYTVDTEHQYPTPQLGGDEDSLPTKGVWRPYETLQWIGNADTEMGYPTADNSEPPDTGYSYGTGLLSPGNNSVGGTEMIMPLHTTSRWEYGGESDPNGETPIANQYLVPFCTEIEISIPKGTYSISKLAQLISDQINGIELPQNNNKDFINDQLQGNGEGQNVKYSGFLVNNTTIRNATVFTENQWTAWNTSGTVIDEFNGYEFDGTYQPPRPFTIYDQSSAGFDCIGLHPRFSNQNRLNILQGYYGVGTPDVYELYNIIHKGASDPQMFLGFQGFNYTTDPPQETDGDLRYNPYQYGIGVGTTDFSIGYDTTKSGFSIDRLHSSRKIPTYDFFGSKNDNAGQEAVYIKRICGANDADRTYQKPAARTGNPMSKKWVQTCSQPMQRTTGLMVLNWAYKTSKRLGSKPVIEGSVEAPAGYAVLDSIPNSDLNPNFTGTYGDNYNKFRTYDEWFGSKSQAREAWEQTLWYKLGFTYDDIQNPINFENAFYPQNSDEAVIDKFQYTGFTTRQKLDSSVIPFASSLYNGQGYTNSEEYKPGNALLPLNNNVSGIQSFTTLDVNVPFNIFNNNKAEKATLGGPTVGAYKGSMLTGAVMIPVLTTSLPVVASRLPILNTNGYLLITSDIVEHNDITKDGKFLGILDMIPKSNLSNQDYVADRNVLTHTISNPTVVQSISVNILNPDLTDVPLEPNSTLLLKITYPLPKQTEVLESEDNQALTQELVQTAKSSIVGGDVINLNTFNQYTSGIPVANSITEQVEAEAQPPRKAEEILDDEDERIREPVETREEARRRINNGKAAVALSFITNQERRQAYIERLDPRDRDSIVRSAVRIQANREEREARGEIPSREQRDRFAKATSRQASGGGGGTAQPSTREVEEVSNVSRPFIRQLIKATTRDQERTILTRARDTDPRILAVIKEAMPNIRKAQIKFRERQQQQQSAGGAARQELPQIQASREELRQALIQSEKERREREAREASPPTRQFEEGRSKPQQPPKKD